jgi:hypothetical protein
MSLLVKKIRICLLSLLKGKYRSLALIIELNGPGIIFSVIEEISIDSYEKGWGLYKFMARHGISKCN